MLGAGFWARYELVHYNVVGVSHSCLEYVDSPSAGKVQWHCGRPEDGFGQKRRPCQLLGQLASLKLHHSRRGNRIWNGCTIYCPWDIHTGAQSKFDWSLIICHRQINICCQFSAWWIQLCHPLLWVCPRFITSGSCSATHFYMSTLDWLVAMEVRADGEAHKCHPKHCPSPSPSGWLSSKYSL